MPACVEPPALPEALMVPEELFASAYERTGARVRSRIKLCIARLHAFWGERPAAVRECRCFRQGFCAEESASPAALALIVCSGTYAYPECLLAACMPAVTAGVERIVVCFSEPKPGRETAGGFGKTPAQGARYEQRRTRRKEISGSDGPNTPIIRPELLTALELAGIEQVLYVNAAMSLPEPAAVLAASASGRLVFLEDAGFGDPADDLFEGLTAEARRLRMPCMTLFRGAPTASGEVSGTAETSEGASICGSGYSLSLDEAHGGVWIWPQLGPDWFLDKALSLRKG